MNINKKAHPRPGQAASKAAASILLSLALLLSSFSPGLAARMPRQADGRATVFSLADLGEDDLVARQIFEQFEIHFPLAEGQRVEQAVLTLHLEHGKKLLSGFSDLTIALNDEPVASLILDENNAAAAYYTIPIPAEALQPGKNSLLLRFNLRLHDTGCSDANSPSLWAKVFADTSLALDTTDLPMTPDLSRFPAPFDTLSGLPGSPQLTFILPDISTSAELTAAARIAAALGQAAGWQEPPMRALTASQVEAYGASADHLIVISLGGNNPLASGISDVLSEQVSPLNPNRLMLTVSAESEEALLQAADLLATRSAHASLATNMGSPAPVSPLPLVEPASRQSFADLGFSEWRVRGIGLHDLYYPIDIPYDWKITSEASIHLSFSHVRGLDTSASLLSVFINGRNISAIELNNRNAADGRLVVQLSPRQLHPGRNWLHLSADLHLDHEDCRYRYLEEAWLQVSAEDSGINLAHVNSQPPMELRYLPSPLVTPADLSSNLFVLPGQPAWPDLTAMVRLAAKLGTHVQADGLRPMAMTAAEFNPQQPPILASADDLHIIAIGSPLSNALLAAYDDQLPQPLRLEDGVVVPAGGRELLPEEAAAPGQSTPAAGYLQLLPAPWSRQTALIVVAAYDASALLRVVEAVPSMAERLRSQGSVAIVTPSKTTGLALGSLANAPLSDSTRVVLAAVLIGAFALIGAIGWFTNLQRKRAAARQALIQQAETI